MDITPISPEQLTAVVSSKTLPQDLVFAKNATAADVQTAIASYLQAKLVAELSRPKTAAEVVASLDFAAAWQTIIQGVPNAPNLPSEADVSPVLAAGVLTP